MCYYCFLLIILSHLYSSVCASLLMLLLVLSELRRLRTTIAVVRRNKRLPFFRVRVHTAFEYICWDVLLVQFVFTGLLYAFVYRFACSFFWSIYSSITRSACIYASIEYVPHSEESTLNHRKIYGKHMRHNEIHCTPALLCSFVCLFFQFFCRKICFFFIHAIEVGVAVVLLLWTKQKKTQIECEESE